MIRHGRIPGVAAALVLAVSTGVAFAMPVLPRVAAEQSPPARRPAVAGGRDAAPQSGDGTIEYIAHAAFLIRSPQGTEVLIDPYASAVWLGYDFPARYDPDALLITHPHYDHDGGRFRELPLWWDDSMQVIDAPGRHQVGDIAVHGIRGKHADPYGKEFGQLNTIMVMSCPNSLP